MKRNIAGAVMVIVGTLIVATIARGQSIAVGTCPGTIGVGDSDLIGKVIRNTSASAIPKVNGIGSSIGTVRTPIVINDTISQYAKFERIADIAIDKSGIDIAVYQVIDVFNEIDQPTFAGVIVGGAIAS